MAEIRALTISQEIGELAMEACAWLKSWTDTEGAHDTMTRSQHGRQDVAVQSSHSGFRIPRPAYKWITTLRREPTWPGARRSASWGEASQG